MLSAAASGETHDESADPAGTRKNKRRENDMSRFSLGVFPLVLVVALLPRAGLAQGSPTETVASATPETVLAAAPYTLHVETSCAASIHIQGVPDLKNHADMQDVPAGLSFRADTHEAWLTGSACPEDVTIQLMQGAAIVSTSMNYDELVVKEVGGPLSLRQGRGDILVDRASALLYRGDGPGDLALDTLGGPSIIATAGPGDVHIDAITAPFLVIGTTGPGDVVIRGGTIDQLAISLSGPGDALFDGIARKAVLRSNASGDIRVHQVLEDEHIHSSGSGTIEITQKAEHGPATAVSDQTRHADGDTSSRKGDISLPDGTRINAHRMIRADGTVIDFDAFHHTGSNVPPTPPAPPRPPEPPAPPGSTAQIPDTEHTAHKPPKTTITIEASSDGGGFTSGTIVLIVLAIVLLRRRIIPRLIPLLHRTNPALAKRLEPFLQSLMARVSVPMPETQLPQLLDLTQRLQKLDKRVSAAEACVTSRDFHLHTQFRDLNRHSD